MRNIFQELKQRYNLWRTLRYYRKMVKMVFGIKPRYDSPIYKKYGKSPIITMLEYQRERNELIKKSYEITLNNYILKQFPETKDWKLVFKKKEI